MTKVHTLILSLLFFVVNIAYSAPIRIGIDKYDPPFVYSINSKTFYGFDVDMMTFLCKEMNRECQFVPLTFDQLLPFVQSKTVDMAASSIFITPERARFINFSIPYLLSYTQFLGKKALADKPFSLDLLHNKRFGYERGTLIPLVIKSLGIINPQLVAFNNNNEVVDAITKGTVDFGLFTENSAIYWESNSGDQLTLVGKPIPFGLGVGIAVNKDEVQLLNDLNKALLNFQNSDEFKKTYNKYISHF